MVDYGWERVRKELMTKRATTRRVVIKGISDEENHAIP